VNVPKAVSSIEVCRELADAGIIPEEMLNRIASATIHLNPDDVAMLELHIVLDKRIYDMVDPRVRRIFAVDGPKGADNSAGH
jgi:hypothetical protein